MREYQRINSREREVTHLLRHIRLLNHIVTVPSYRFAFPAMELSNFFRNDELDNQIRQDEWNSYGLAVANFNEQHGASAHEYNFDYNRAIVAAIGRFVDHHFLPFVGVKLKAFLFEKPPVIWPNAVVRYLTLQRLHHEANYLAALSNVEFEIQSYFGFSEEPAETRVLRPYHDFCRFINIEPAQTHPLVLGRFDANLVLDHQWSLWQLTMPNNYPVSPHSVLKRAIENDVITVGDAARTEFDCLPFLSPTSYYGLLFTLYLKFDGRVRICEVCDDGFWAYFGDQNTCSKGCSNALSQRRRRREQKGDEYRFRVDWGGSWGIEASLVGGRNEKVCELTNKLSSNQVRIRQLTPYDLKKIRQKLHRRRRKRPKLGEKREWEEIWRYINAEMLTR